MISLWLKKEEKKQRKRNKRRKKKTSCFLSVCWMFRENCKYIDLFTWPKILSIKLRTEQTPKWAVGIQTTCNTNTHVHNKTKQTDSGLKEGGRLYSSPSMPTQPPHLESMMRCSGINTALGTGNQIRSGSTICHVTWRSCLIFPPSLFIAW